MQTDTGKDDAVLCVAQVGKEAMTDLRQYFATPFWGRLVGTMLVMVASLAGGVAFGADGGTLKYRQMLSPMFKQEEWYDLEPQQLSPAPTKPQVRVEPAYVGEPTYFLIELGEKDSPPYVAAYDPKGGQGKGCVYFDLDHDGDLAEEQPILPQASAPDYFGPIAPDYFGPIAAEVTRGGATGVYHCWMRIFEYAGATSPFAAVLRPGCINVGEITFEGKTYKAAMVDAWTNGRFNDRCWSTAFHTAMVDAWTERPFQIHCPPRLGHGDVLLVDWNGDGKFDMNADEYVMVGERYWRDGKWYRTSFSAYGTEVTFAPGAFELAPVLTGHDRFWMQVTSKSDMGSLRVEGVGGRVDLPVDAYGLYLSSVEAKDAQGNTWKAESFRDGPYPDFQVTAGQENECLFGPPFTVSLEASKAWPEGPYQAGMLVVVDAHVTGREGKTYAVTCNGREIPTPTLVLRDESGKVIRSYDFYEVGLGHRLGCAWRVPANVSGKVTVTVSIDLGPFAWKAEDLVLEVE